MVSSMQQILPIVWNTLTESAALYPSQVLPAVSVVCCDGSPIAASVK